MEWGTWSYWISTLQLLPWRLDILSSPSLVPITYLHTCNWLHLDIYHLDHKLIQISLMYTQHCLQFMSLVIFRQGALCLAEFRLGLLLPVPACSSPPPSGCLWAVRALGKCLRLAFAQDRSRVRRTCHPWDVLKINVFSKISSRGASKPFLFASMFLY